MNLSEEKHVEKFELENESLKKERDQYRRGIKALDKLFHETNGIWDEFLDGMTLHDYLWEAGQPGKEEEDA